MEIQAPKPGWVINPNARIVEGIKRALKRTGGHCPCDNPYKGTDDDLCPCKAYREENHCCCHLYVPETWN